MQDQTSISKYRIRRVKCDEAKPSCLRCTSTGRKCDGYAPVTAPKSQENPTNKTSSDCAILIRKSYSPAFEIFEDDAERRSFSFFKERTLAEIAGYFPSDFWERLVPLATFHEPALKHAAIALASLHERFEKGDRSVLKPNNDIAEGGFALQQYNKAIRSLIKPGEHKQKPALDTSLSLRGHHGSALSHINSGTQILTQVNDEQKDLGEDNYSQQLCVPLETLEVVFTRLDSQAVQLLGKCPMPLPRPKPNAHSGFHPDIPAVFQSLEEARNSLDYQLNICIQRDFVNDFVKHFKEGIESQEQRDAYDIDRTRFRSAFRRWSTAFQVFLDENVAAMDSKSLQGAMVLKLNAKMATMHLDVSTSQLLYDQTCWDSIIPVFEDLADLAAAIIDAQKAANERLFQKPIFQLDHSIIGPLFNVAHKCRDPHLRRRAISLLYSAPRQEGVWDSILTARVCERIMNLEEEGLGEVRCAADVPDWRRISDIQVTFDLQARRGEITMSRLRSCYSNVREPVTDIVEW
ncbi:MAG: hypothetical protein Q9209_005712 [Squamulea sp. 1 TL-2023]